MKRDQLIGDVYEYFHVHGKWPPLRFLQGKYGSGINVRALVAELGSDLVVCPEGTDAECFLTLEALESHDPAAADLQILTEALRVTAEAFKEHGSAPISHNHFASALGLTALETRRLGLLLARLQGVWSSSSVAPDGNEFSITPAEPAFFFDRVKTFADVRATKQRLDSEARQISKRNARDYAERRRRLSGMQDSVPAEPQQPAYRLADPRLNTIFASDYAELAQVRAAGTWKAVAAMAGMCLETLLLDLCEQSERARRRFINKSPREIRGIDLLKAAQDFQLIEPDYYGLADAIRRWRNIIHPAASRESPEPTKELAEALVSSLNLILSHVTARRELDQAHAPVAESG
jgi:hypothetical protein